MKLETEQGRNLCFIVRRKWFCVRRKMWAIGSRINLSCSLPVITASMITNAVVPSIYHFNPDLYSDYQGGGEPQSKPFYSGRPTR